MAQFAVNGASAATAATAGVAVAAVWNPSTSKRIKVLELHIFKTTAGAADVPTLRRITARGTATTTSTPAAPNEWEQIAAPPSGFLLDLAYSAQPTIVALPALYGAVIPAAIGAGLMWVFGGGGLEVPIGAGLAIVTGSALAFPASQITAIVED